MIDFAKAINSLEPKAEFLISDNDFNKIEWLSTDITQPSQTEIQAEVTRLESEYDSQQYARDRASAYPSLQDQADMAYWDRKNGTTTLDDAITAVKSAYPKT
jgi:hypothetical protein